MSRRRCSAVANTALTLVRGSGRGGGGGGCLLCQRLSNTSKPPSAHQLLFFFFLVRFCLRPARGCVAWPARVGLPQLAQSTISPSCSIFTPQISREVVRKVPTNLQNMHLKRLKSAVLVIPVRVVTVYTCKSRMHCRTN